MTQPADARELPPVNGGLLLTSKSERGLTPFPPTRNLTPHENAGREKGCLSSSRHPLHVLSAVQQGPTSNASTPNIALGPLPGGFRESAVRNNGEHPRVSAVAPQHAFATHRTAATGNAQRPQAQPWAAAFVIATALWPAQLSAQTLTGLRKEGNTVHFQLREGGAELEWISPYAFRFYRTFDGAPEASSPLTTDSVEYTIEERGEQRWIKTAEISVEIDPAAFRLRVHDPQRKISLTEWETTGAGQLERALLPDERIYGIGPRNDPRLDARGQKLQGIAGAFYVSSRGYGVYTTGGPHDFDLSRQLTVHFSGTKELEYVFYAGPRLKDIYERHLALAPQGWILLRHHAGALNRLQKPSYAPELPLSLPELLHASLAGTLIPSVDCLKHFEPWCAYLPVILADERAQPARSRLEPYLLAYFQETKDRGYPMLRPLALQYPSDRDAGVTADAFMLGDELLVAPLPPAANRRRVTLPRGNWTDLRTNVRHAGRQTIDVEGPASSPPVFARNGSIVPFKVKAGEYELHYFPKLAAEFFIYEVEQQQWTQVHAAPNGDYMRMEIESKVERDYEWVIHHVAKPLEVDSKAKLTWRYDDKLGNVHIKLHAAANGDEIINIRLPD